MRVEGFFVYHAAGVFADTTAVAFFRIGDYEFSVLLTIHAIFPPGL